MSIEGRKKLVIALAVNLYCGWFVPPFKPLYENWML